MYQLFNFSKKNRLLFIAILFVLQWLIVLPFFHPADTAQTKSDSHEYQMFAVNFSEGRGVNVYGALTSAEDYKLDIVTPELKNLWEQTNAISTYRMPVYGIFAGIVYSFFGVSPLILKYIQLLLIIIVSVSLPWLGFRFWGERGFISGVIGSFVHTLVNSPLATFVLTETLIMFFFWLIVVVYSFYLKRQHTLLAALLGLIMGTALLLKGNFIFIPFLILLIELYFSYKQKTWKRLRLATISLIFLVAVITPWSIYATKHYGSTVILSTQGSEVFADGNNEYNVESGVWAPAWRTDQNCFLNIHKNESKSEKVLIAKFYLQNPLWFIKAMVKKFFAGIYLNFLMFILFTLVIAHNISILFLKKNNNLSIKFAILFLVGILGAIPFLSALSIYIKYAEAYDFLQNILPFQYFFVEYSYPIYLIWLIVIIWGIYQSIRKQQFSDLPIPLAVVFLNCWILTQLTFGDIRFLWVLNFVFILLVFDYLLKIISKRS